MKREVHGICALCGERRILTGEHIYADWLSKHVHSKYSNSSFKFVDPSGAVKETIYPVPTGQIKVPTLCAKCNNEWGSNIQQRSRRVLEPLVTGKWPALNKNDRLALARWFSCFLMIREFIHSEIMVLSQSVRTTFYCTGQPPENLNIWIAPFFSNRYDFASSLRGLMIDAEKNNSERNLLLATLVIGKVIIFGYWSCHSSIIEKNSAHQYAINRYLSNHGLSQTWPTFREFPKVRPPDLTDRDFEYLKQGITETLANPIEYTKIVDISTGRYREYFGSFEE